jgi:hypothetical protein
MFRCGRNAAAGVTRGQCVCVKAVLVNESGVHPACGYGELADGSARWKCIAVSAIGVA